MTTTETRPPQSDGRDPKEVRRLLIEFALPLFFVIGLAATLVTALHKPLPHDLALGLAGPPAATSATAQQLESADPSRFDITAFDTVSAARAAVEHRDVVGAVVLPAAKGDLVQVVVASAGGRSAAAIVQQVGTSIATRAGTAVQVVDVAPLDERDPLGTALFYWVVYCGIGGYLTLIVLTQVMPRARLRTRYLAGGIGAVLAPLLVVGLQAIWVGGLGVGFATFCAVWGVLALYTATVALAVILGNQLLGSRAMFFVAPVVLLINLPSAGGGAPEFMLPGFWQAMHQVWFGSGAFEAARDLVYFPDASPLRWILQLGIWTATLLAITSLIHAIRQASALRAANSELMARVAALKEQTAALPEPVHAQPVDAEPIAPRVLTATRSDRLAIDRREPESAETK
jgi:hypothetical protein